MAKYIPASDGIAVCKSDMLKFISYLEDAAKLYDALAVLPMQKCNSRSFMIRQLITKYKTKIPKK